MRDVRRDLFFASVHDALVGVPSAAGVLYRISQHLLPKPMIITAAMTLGSASVVANTLRWRTMRPV